MEQSNQGITFTGEDMSLFQLFYAGTTHKLQGSQSKLIIFVLDDFRSSDFITREMIYTMITRGSDLVIGVGSVGSYGSMLERARKDVNIRKVNTIGELIK